MSTAPPPETDIFVSMYFESDEAGKSFRDFVSQYSYREASYKVLNHISSTEFREFHGYIYDQQNFLAEVKLRGYDVRSYTYGNFRDFIEKITR